MEHDAIVIEGLSKSYQRGRLRKPDLRTTLTSWKQQWKTKKEEFFALKDINLVIKQGEVAGILGPNGAGKSTLLKLLSRITFPTTGKIVIRGTLSSMLEVGTGFHPELTGRENIYLNGAMIGMSREEVSRKLDSIVAFSGVEAFLDTPVKHYSSGMYVRLAFAVASHLEPDILLIDEVLAVGDHEFKRKCMDKLMDVSVQGRTILMVSHQMSYLQELCRTGIYLNEGRIVYSGPIEETINQYVNDYSQPRSTDQSLQARRRGSGNVRINKFDLLDEERNRIHTIFAGQTVIFNVELEVHVPEIFNLVVQIEIYDLHGQICFVANNTISGTMVPSLTGKHVMECMIPKFPLNTHLYFANVVLYDSNKLADEALNVLSFEVAQGPYYETGKLPPPNKGFLTEYIWQIKNLTS